MQTSNIYILAHESKPMFKIGIANDVAGRIAQIGQKVDLARSFCAQGSRDAVERSERVMHSLLRSSRLKKVTGSGGTEWFCDSALAEAISVFEKVRDLTGVTRLESVLQQQEKKEIAAEKLRASLAEERSIAGGKRKKNIAQMKKSCDQLNKDSLVELKKYVSSISEISHYHSHTSGNENIMEVTVIIHFSEKNFEEAVAFNECNAFWSIDKDEMYRVPTFSDIEKVCDMIVLTVNCDRVSKCHNETDSAINRLLQSIPSWSRY